MSGLSPSTRQLPILDDLSTFGDARRVGVLIRYRGRQQEIDRYAERTGNLLMQGYRALALSRFKVRQIALRNAHARHQFGLRQDRKRTRLNSSHTCISYAI